MLSLLLLCRCRRGPRSKGIDVAVVVVVVAVRALRPVRRSHWRPSPAVRSTLWVQLWWLLLPKRRWAGSRRKVLVMLLIVVAVASSTMSSLSRPTTTRAVGQRSVDDGEDGETLRRNEPFSLTTSITYDFAGDACQQEIKRQKLGGDCDWVMQEQQRIKRKIRWNLELRTPFKNIFESESHVHLCPELQQFSDRQL